MEVEVWIAVAAVFVSGGAIGTAGTLLAQWVLRGFAIQPQDSDPLAAAEVTRLRNELRFLMRQVRNMDERLDFQEQLLGGGSPTHTPPPRLTGEEAGHGSGGEVDAEAGAGPADEAGGGPAGSGAG